MTQSKQEEEVLKEGEVPFRDLFVNAADAIFIADMESGVILDANRAASKLMLLPLDKIVGLHQSKLHPEQKEEDSKESFEKYWTAADQKIPRDPFEYMVLRSDGVEVPVEILGSMVTVRGKKCLMGTFRDITERKIRETRFERDHKLFELIAKTELTFIKDKSPADVFGKLLDDFLVLMDSEYGFFGEVLYTEAGQPYLRTHSITNIAWNDETRKFVADNEEKGLEFCNLNTLFGTVLKTKKAVVSNDPYHDPRRGGLPEGHPAMNSFLGIPFMLEGQMLGMAGIANRPGGYDTEIVEYLAPFATVCANIIVSYRMGRDKTLATEALRNSEEEYRLVFDNAGDAIIILDDEGRVLAVNAQTEKQLGYSHAELMFMTVDQVDSPEESHKAPERIAVLKEHGYHKFETVHQHKDGSLVSTEVNARRIIWRGKPALISICRDITERKRVEEKLRESEEYVRNILNTVDEGFIVVDRDYRIMTANRAYCDQVSLPRDEVVGRHCYEVSHLAERPCFEEGEECPVRGVFATGMPHQAVHKHPNKDGETLFVEAKAFPNIDESGNVVSVIETVSNITERLLLEEERLKSQKLESIGTLAGGIAHDFNNLLQGVFGHISMARMSIDKKEESLSLLKEAEAALHQTVSLTNQLLTFAKGGKPVKKHVPILPVVESAARFALSGSSCMYEILPQEDLWLVNGDAGQIGQVIQNIVLNADQSMPRGGIIRITVRNATADSKKPVAIEKGDYMLISIQDKGIGIPEESRARIFDPYFTTKERGSGLGLATSYSIVRNHGGIIEVESRLGEGTNFTIYLPAIREKIQETTAVAAPAEARAAKVLIMDDEEIIRRITGKQLCSLGHKCEFAEKGESAVAMFKAAHDEGRPFDLVLLDLTIRGGMGGAETLQELLAIDPEVKAIVSSGYSDDNVLSDYLSQGFKLFLKKPYSLDELRDGINSVLG